MTKWNTSEMGAVSKCHEPLWTAIFGPGLISLRINKVLKPDVARIGDFLI